MILSFPSPLTSNPLHLPCIQSAQPSNRSHIHALLTIAGATCLLQLLSPPTLTAHASCLLLLSSHSSHSEPSSQSNPSCGDLEVTFLLEAFQQLLISSGRRSKLLTLTSKIWLLLLCLTQTYPPLPLSPSLFFLSLSLPPTPQLPQQDPLA